MKHRVPVRRLLLRSLAFGLVALGLAVLAVGRPAAGEGPGRGSKSLSFRAPAGTRPTARSVVIPGWNYGTGAILPNGRLVTPYGMEVSVQAPKPYGLALSPDGRTLATVNSGTRPFSISLVRDLESSTPSVTLIPVVSAFMGITFSAEGSRFYASGGENGVIWVGDTAGNRIIGSVNLNGVAHAIAAPWTVTSNPGGRFKGTFPGNLALGAEGRYLYVVDQGSFDVFVIDTREITTGVNASGQLTEPNNFDAVVGRQKAGRYPYAVAPTPDGQRLLVANVGVFQYRHLQPAAPTGDPNTDYPLGYPGAGYPDETENDRTIRIKKVDPRNLPDSLRDPEGIRVGYIDQDIDYAVPGLGSPNVPESSSVYAFEFGSTPDLLRLGRITKTGPKVGQVERGIPSFSGSHPNAIAVGPDAVYVSNGNNDSVSILHPRTLQELGRVSLSVLKGVDAHLKGVQPVSLAVSPNGAYLYVAEAGLNAVAVLRLNGRSAKVVGHIPVGWWPSGVQVSADGRTLYVANARGRGALPNTPVPPDNLGSPRSSTIGSVSIVPVPNERDLKGLTERVLLNNGFAGGEDGLDEGDRNDPIPSRPGEESRQIKHVIFLNKENATHDLLLGDITATRKGVPVEGEPSYSLGVTASPNHHELALRYGDHLFPEYNTHIPDAPLPEDPARFNRFGRFKQVFESQFVDRETGVCKLPSYVDLFYPNDHGGGANHINPTGPQWDFTRFVQDNDAALGLTVELVSNSPCWKDTVIFVVEDDTQNGYDHVDGYRSLLMVISPWAKREYVSKTHASLASVFKTVNLILGLPPLNQYDAAATDLRDMFTGTPDFTPYQFRSIDYASIASSAWQALTKDVDFSRPDADELNLRHAIAKSVGLPRPTAAGHQQ